MKKKQSKRRGILLLIVLSLLSLFVLAGITFIVVAGQYRRASISGTQVERVGENPVLMNERVVLDLLNASSDSSLLASSGLLGDLYGNDGFSGTITSASLAGGNQLLDLTVAGLADISGAALAVEAGDFGGGLLTLTTGENKNSTVRILKHTATVITVELVSLNDGQTAAGVAASLAGESFWVNGRPFNGAGLGFDGTTLDATVDVQLSAGPTAIPVALLPNLPASINAGEAYLADPNSFEVFGLDETWDAPDYQNLFLGMLPSVSLPVSIPSFHRPYLVQYFGHADARNIPFDMANADLWRRVIARPTQLDHPQFTGSNPNPTAHPLGFDPINGPWDVDNDGDGVQDSVWIDVGLPVSIDKNGRQVKPLVAIFCIDLDGRLNLNAHGSEAHLAPTYLNGTNPNRPTNQEMTLAGRPSAPWVPHGVGYGTADVCLSELLGTADHSTVIQGRYVGKSDSADVSVGDGSLRDDDLFTYDAAEGTETISLKTVGFLGRYSTPSDLTGAGVVALDHAGQPVFSHMGFAGEDLNDPYEFNLLNSSGYDSAYTISDLEPLLRWYDQDAVSLSQRLTGLAGFNTAANRQNATTASFAVPSVPSTPSEIAPGIATATREVVLPFELFRGEPMDLNRPFGNGEDDDGNGVVDEFLEFDNGTGPLTMGYPIDSDFMRNFVADHVPAAVGDTSAPSRYPMRQVYARHLYSMMMFLRDTTSNIFDFNGDGTALPEETAISLAQWAINVVDFCDSDSIMTPFEFDLDPTNGWNADGDISSIDAECAVVWGSERPELLITETLAFHDRRAEDLPNDTNATLAGGGIYVPQPRDGSGTARMPGEDDDFDQRLRPVGAGFIEIYNPWMNNGQSFAPEEFYRGSTGVELDAPNAAWRVLVVRDQRANAQTTWQGVADLDWYFDHATAATTIQSIPIGEYSGISTVGAIGSDITIDRSIYFVDPTAAGVIDPNDGDEFFQNRNVAPIKPGRYAVIGSFEQQVDIDSDGTLEFVTPVGRRVGATDAALLLDETRRIELSPVPDPDINQVDVFNDGMNSQYNASNMQPVVAVVVDQQASLPPGTTSSFAFSTPSVPYTNNGWNELGANGLGEYTVPRDAPFDSPLDSTSTLDPADREAIHKDGTTGNFRTVLLQRLANPLQPWNAVTNPYRTVSYSTVNLVSFNGIQDDVDFNNDGNSDDDDLIPLLDSTAGETRALATSQQGDSANVGSRARLLFRNVPTFDDTEKPGGGDHVFDYELENSLGWLNTTFKGRAASGNVNAKYVGMPDTTAGQSFAWLTWSNRPFASKFELMNVPRSSSSRLPLDYDVPPTSSEYAAGDLGRFPHLVNFLQADFHRIFDFVDVPSRFVGAERWYTGEDFRSIPYFRPPFNRLSRFRVPGKINLNTASTETLDAVFFGLDATIAPSADIIQTREGRSSFMPATVGDQKYFPTAFVNPFKKSHINAGDYVGSYAPILNDSLTDAISGAAIPSDRLQQGAADSFETTILRPTSSTPIEPILSLTEIAQHRNTDRNPYFRNLAFQRAGNVFSSNSNVFAVWVTIGYFDFEDTNGDGIREFGREVGEGTGNIERNRGFYVIDRSKPVCFEPGVRRNEEDTIVLHRMLE